MRPLIFVPERGHEGVMGNYMKSAIGVVIFDKEQ